MSDSYTTTEQQEPTIVEIRRAIVNRVTLSDTPTKAEVVVDVGKQLGVAEARVNDALEGMMKKGDVYFVGDGADAEVKAV